MQFPKTTNLDDTTTNHFGGNWSTKSTGPSYKPFLLTIETVVHFKKMEPYLFFTVRNTKGKKKKLKGKKC